MLLLEIFELGALDTNCYLVYDNISREGVVIDPGYPDTILLSKIGKLNISITHILLTHAHFDHMFGVKYFHKRLDNPKIILNQNDFELYKKEPLFMEEFVSNYSITDYYQGEIIKISDSYVINISNYSINTIETPGHTSGSVVYYIEEYNWLFTGDTVFAERTGRTDFESGNKQTIDNSILKLKRIYHNNSEEILIYPGHGRSVTLEYALQQILK